MSFCDPSACSVLSRAPSRSSSTLDSAPTPSKTTRYPSPVTARLSPACPCTQSVAPTTTCANASARSRRAVSGMWSEANRASRSGRGRWPWRCRNEAVGAGSWSSCAFVGVRDWVGEWSAPREPGAAPLGLEGESRKGKRLCETEWRWWCPRRVFGGETDASPAAGPTGACVVARAGLGAEGMSATPGANGVGACGSSNVPP